MLSNNLKQANIKLIPSDPMTNTILIIYCVSNNGISIPYKSQWKKLSIKNQTKIQSEIKNHNGTSYRCSPLDEGSIIQVTITIIGLNNIPITKVLQTNPVKISRQLKEKKNYVEKMDEKISCKLYPCLKEYVGNNIYGNSSLYADCQYRIGIQNCAANLTIYKTQSSQKGYQNIPNSIGGNIGSIGSNIGSIGSNIGSNTPNTHTKIKIMSWDIDKVEVQNNICVFKLYFKEKIKFEEVLQFLMLNTTNYLSSSNDMVNNNKNVVQQHFLSLEFIFTNDIHRDIILLGLNQLLLASSMLLNQSKSKEKIIQMKKSSTNIVNKNKMIENQLNKSVKIPYTPQPAQKKMEYLNIFQDQDIDDQFINVKDTQFYKKESQQPENHQGTPWSQPQTPPDKKKYKQEDEKACLNIFQDDDINDQFLNRSNSDVEKKNIKKFITKVNNKNQKNNNKNDAPSINLRDSFQELERSFNQDTFRNKILDNDKVSQRSFISEVKNNAQLNANKKLQKQNEKLLKEVEKLKKQNQLISILTKENNSLKKKYHEMKQEINRLELERKVILTQKLRCEVNWHKESQQKQILKKQMNDMKLKSSYASSNDAGQINNNNFSIGTGGISTKSSLNQQASQEPSQESASQVASILAEYTRGNTNTSHTSQSNNQNNTIHQNKTYNTNNSNHLNQPPLPLPKNHPPSQQSYGNPSNIKYGSNLNNILPPQQSTPSSALNNSFTVNNNVRNNSSFDKSLRATNHYTYNQGSSQVNSTHTNYTNVNTSSYNNGANQSSQHYAPLLGQTIENGNNNSLTPGNQNQERRKSPSNKYINKI